MIFIFKISAKKGKVIGLHINFREREREREGEEKIGNIA